MKRFLIDTSVENAEGTQTWFVDAETEEDALDKFSAGGCDLYESNVDVTQCGEPEISGEVPLDDFGRFADQPPAAQPAPESGSWYAASDIDKMARDLDAALNGEGAAPQAKLCDLMPQLIQRLTAPAPTVQEPVGKVIASVPHLRSISVKLLPEVPVPPAGSLIYTAPPAARPVQKRPQNCGTGYCSCIECVMEPAPVQKPDADALDGDIDLFDDARSILEIIVHDQPADLFRDARALIPKLRARIGMPPIINFATPLAAPCTWTKSPDPHMPDTFNATCGVVWTFTDGGPAENDVRFCPGCGADVSVAAPEPEKDLYDLAVKADNGGQP